MKPSLLLTLPGFIFFSGCVDNSGIDSVAEPADSESIRTVTLRSHLTADITVDPVLRLGEIVRIQPDKMEPFASYEPIRVKLPPQTPYTGHDSQHYLRGYAVGQAARKNKQFL